MVETVRAANLAVLVTEPTPFGMSDLDLAVETAGRLGVPFVVALNRSDVAPGGDRLNDQGIEVVARMPDDRRVAEAYARGELAVRAVPGYRDAIVGLWRAIAEEVTR
jgi:MinD superfamily P-loop ATPase